MGRGPQEVGEEQRGTRAQRWCRRGRREGRAARGSHECKLKALGQPRDKGGDEAFEALLGRKGEERGYRAHRKRAYRILLQSASEIHAKDACKDERGVGEKKHVILSLEVHGFTAFE